MCMHLSVWCLYCGSSRGEGVGRSVLKSWSKTDKLPMSQVRHGNTYRESARSSQGQDQCLLGADMDFCCYGRE